MKKTGVLILLFAALSFSAHSVSADDTEANAKYLSSLMQVACNGDSSCQAQYGLYLNAWKIPTSSTGLVAYEAGVIESVCTKTWTNPWNRELCFARAIRNSTSPALKSIAVRCGSTEPKTGDEVSRKKLQCYETALKPVYTDKVNGGVTSCEAKLVAVEQQLTALNPAINSADLKKSIQVIVDGLRSSTAAGAAQ